MARMHFRRLMILVGLSVLTVGCPKEAPQSLHATNTPETPASTTAAPAKPVTPPASTTAAPEPAFEADFIEEPIAEPDLETYVSPGNILWVPPQNAGISSLSLRDPFGTVSEFEFASGEAPYLDVAGLADGLYVYQVAVEPALDLRTVTTMEEVADDPILRESMVQQLVDSGLVSENPIGQSGSFMIADGSIIPGDALTKGVAGATDQDGGNFTKDQFINDDLVVVGSGCFGFDCVNNENFGFDTIRLKENNLRIRFQDTSNSASFPSNDWQLVANDSTNGGQNRFSIEDIDHARTPFTVEAGARNHALYVDDGGRIGFGTNTPVVELHSKDGDTPTLRLEQDGSSGFTPQTWDLASNETNFFIRDATNGSKLPFRIRPGAPTSSIDIKNNGDVGFGTQNPDAQLHARSTTEGNPPELKLEHARTDGTPHVQWKNDSFGWSLGMTGTEGKLVLRNLADFLTGVDTNDAITINNTLDIAFGRDSEAKRLVRWGDGFNRVGRLSFTGIGGNPAIIAEAGKALEFWTGAGVGTNRLSISNAGNTTVHGNLTVNGTFSNPSDRNIKDAIEAIDPRDVLEKVVGMPISTWRYQKEDDSIRHLGPMAQDFKAAFGLGEDDRYITSIDADGVSLAAIQGLNQKLEEKDALIAEQARTLQALADRVEALEKAAQ